MKHAKSWSNLLFTTDFVFTFTQSVPERNSSEWNESLPRQKERKSTKCRVKGTRLSGLRIISRGSAFYSDIVSSDNCIKLTGGRAKKNEHLGVRLLRCLCISSFSISHRSYAPQRNDEEAIALAGSSGAALITTLIAVNVVCTDVAACWI